MKEGFQRFVLPLAFLVCLTTPLFAQRTPVQVPELTASAAGREGSGIRQEQDRQPQTDIRPVTSRSSVYAELLGQGLLYSINYDYRIGDHASIRAGFSAWSIPALPFVTGDLSFTGFPLMVNFLTGDGDAHCELGAGIIPAIVSLKGSEIFFSSDVSTGDLTTVIGTATIGFRLQPPEGGFLFRIGITPFIGSGGSEVSGGLSAGVAF